MADKIAGHENARQENARQEIAGRENAGHEIADKTLSQGAREGMAESILCAHNDSWELATLISLPHMHYTYMNIEYKY